jgi:hypothetical protein
MKPNATQSKTVHGIIGADILMKEGIIDYLTIAYIC